MKMNEQWDALQKQRRNINGRTRMASREEVNRETSIIIQITKALLLAYVITGVLLVILAFLLYRFQLTEKVIAVGIILIYIVATFIGGFVLGKYVKVKKYFWGMISGGVYVILLFLITFGVYRMFDSGEVITTIILCTCSGTIGGMLS